MTIHTVSIPELLELFLVNNNILTIYNENVIEKITNENMCPEKFEDYLISEDEEDYISASFYWKSTKQGHVFWLGIHTRWQEFLKEWRGL